MSEHFAIETRAVCRLERGERGVVASSGMAAIRFVSEESTSARRTFVRPLQLFSLADSLGGIASTHCHCATMTHTPIDQALRLVAGIGNNLLRLSVGIENADDPANDITGVLNASACGELLAANG